MRPEPYYADESVTVYGGDCLRDGVLASLPDCSVDAVVCDPPYGLGFMGKAWDSFASGDSPMRRNAAMDAVNTGASRQGGRQRAGDDYAKRQARDSRSYGEWCEQWAAECLRVLKPGGHLLAFGGTRTYHRIACAVEDAGFEIRDSISWLYGSGFPKSLNVGEGRGTALKPAHEPIVVGRKSLVGTVAANVLAHGTGALNVDACRVESGERPVMVRTQTTVAASSMSGASTGATPNGEVTTLGRWPANVVFDESQAAELDKQSGTLASGVLAEHHARAPKEAGILGAYGSAEGERGYGDSGGASRFFPTFRYEAKAGSAERPTVDGVLHPTVKPLDLMRWLVRLVTPSGGVVLDPFLGSGTTAEACIIEGFRCIGIEREADYLPLIVARLTKPIETVLDFGEAS